MRSFGRLCILSFVLLCVFFTRGVAADAASRARYNAYCSKYPFWWRCIVAKYYAQLSYGWPGHPRITKIRTSLTVRPTSTETENGGGTTATTATSSSGTSSTEKPSSTTAPTSSNATSTSESPKATITGSLPKPSSTKCPSGSSWKAWSDDFTKFYKSKWSLASGSPEQAEWSDKGLSISINKTANDFVYQSVPQWVPPVTMRVSTQTMDAPGMVGCAIFKNADASDEIDLELVRSTFQIPLWKAGKRVAMGTRCKEEDLASTTTKRSDWVYIDSAQKPFDGFHDWTVVWEENSVTWYGDGNKKLIKLTRVGGDPSIWPLQPLHARIGTWAAENGWAEGKPDWRAYPEMIQKFRAIAIEGCMKA